jgi:hypothetical protein
MGVVLFNSVRAGRWGYTVGRKGMAYLQIEELFLVRAPY